MPSEKQDYELHARLGAIESRLDMIVEEQVKQNKETRPLEVFGMLSFAAMAVALMVWGLLAANAYYNPDGN